MKKTLAESMRAALDLLSEAPAGMADALQDLHNESGGRPTAELAADIAGDYNLKPEQLLAAYPKWAQTQANKTPVEPYVSPEKAAQIAKHRSNERRKEWEAERARKTAEQEAEKQAFREKNADLIKHVEAEVEAVQAPAGWTKTVQPGEYMGRQDIADMIFTNDAGDVKLVMHVTFCDPETPEMGNWKRPETPYEVHGDTKFKYGEDWFTFTDYSKWGDSFSISQYSHGATSFADIPAVIAHENERAQAAMDRKALRR